MAAVPAPASASVVRGQALSPDGQDLYVISQDGEEDGALSHFKVGAGGALTYVGCYGLPAGCGPSGFDEFTWPKDIEVSADGRDVYVLAPGLGQYRRAADGRLTYVGRAEGRLGESRALALSPDGRNAYVASGDENPFTESRIVHFRRDPETGAHSYAGCVGADIRYGTGCPALPAGVVSTAGANAIVVSADSRHVYTTGSTGSSNAFEGPKAVTHFRAAADGTLTFADCIGNETSGCSPTPVDTDQHRQGRLTGLAFDAGGLAVGQSGPYSDTITRFALGTDGALVYAGCSGFTSAPGCTFGSGTPTGTRASVELEAPDGATQMTVGLNARINPYGARYAVRWEYGPTTSYGRFDEGGSTSSAGGGWTRVTKSLRDLAPGTTYHYRLVVNTPAGPAYSPDATFTTQPYGEGPGLSVETHQPLGRTGTAAAFAATVQGTGRYWFEWGETQELGRTTPPREIPVLDWSERSVKELVTGLEPGKQYHYRVVAENGFGRVVARSGAAVLPFTGAAEPGPQPTPSPSPEPTASSDPSPPPDAGPSHGAEPTSAAAPDAGGRPILATSALPGPVTVGPAAPAERGSAAPARPRVSVSNRRIVVTVSARTRITIHRRAGKRWVHTATLTTSRTVRRTVKPGIYRVTAGPVRRQVRVR